MKVNLPVTIDGTDLGNGYWVWLQANVELTIGFASLPSIEIRSFTCSMQKGNGPLAGFATTTTLAEAQASLVEWSDGKYGKKGKVR